MKDKKNVSIDEELEVIAKKPFHYRSNMEEDPNYNKLYNFSGFIFNVYQNHEKNYTRFIVSINSLGKHVEYTLHGIIPNISSKYNNLQESKFIVDDIENPTGKIYIDDKEFLIHNEKIEQNKNIKKDVEENNSNWEYSLSFYDPNRFFQSRSGKKLSEEEIEELISKIKKDTVTLDNHKKLLLVNYIRKEKNLKMKNIKNLINLATKK